MEDVVMDISQPVPRTHDIHRRVSRMKSYSDRLIGIGPFGIGLDGIISWVPIPGVDALFSASAGAWLIVQALRAGASAGTISRMLAYLGIDTAVSAVPVPVLSSVADTLWQGHLMAANALLKDIESRHPELKPVKKGMFGRRPADR